MSEGGILSLKPARDVNGEAGTANTKQISAISSPIWPIPSFDKPG
jgi:hypothetical protein